MLNKLVKSTILASSVTFGLAIMTAPASFAQSYDYVSPALIMQNIGTYDSNGTLGEAVEDILTLADLEVMLELTGLSETLDSDTYTVFAPRDSSFWQINSDDYKMLMQGDSDTKDVLLSHVVLGKIDSSTLVSEITSSGSGTSTRETLNGKTLTFALDGPYVTITDSAGNLAEITHADISVRNGQIHIINSVMAVDNNETTADYS